MYCKMCGTEINSLDLFCKVCGTKNEEAKAQESSDSLEQKHEEFTWNIYEFPKPRKTEDIDFRWNLHSEDEKEEIDPPAQETEQIVWEMPKKEPLIKEPPTEEIVVESFEDLPGAPLKEAPLKQEDKTSLEEPQADEVSDMDKFFTFSKKNEEFQQLLDREYEKIQKKNTERPTCKENQISGLLEDLECTKEGKEVSELFSEKESITKVEDDTKPIDIEAVRKACKEVSQVQKTEPGEISDLEMATKLAAHADHLEEMMAARASFFTEEPEEKAILEKEDQKNPSPFVNETVVGPNTEVLVTVEVKANGVSETVTRQTISMEPIDPNLVQNSEPDTTVVTPESVASTPEKTEEKPDLNNTLSQDDLTEFWKKNTFGMEEEKKISGAKIALGVIVTILVIEILTLGIQYFFPQSTAAKVIYQTQSKIVDIFKGAADGVSGIFKTEDKRNLDSGEDKNSDEATAAKKEKETLKEKTPVEPNPVPMSDKTVLIESQIGLNKNIQIISKADDIVFNPSHNYGIEDLNKSAPIENNIWYTDENGKTYYYDQSIVGSLIAFDSQWIDYVNNGDKAVLDLLKPNSKAYKKVSSFSKVGKISEVFQSLSIGEIRKGSVGFYVFTEEKIQVTERGKTRVDSHDWIYYLEPIEGQMKIVNYL